VFDFRYHALSLAAVLVAVVLGLLLGVAIGDSGLGSSAERHIRDNLRADVRKSSRRADVLERNIARKERFERDVYPLLVGGQLEGKRIGLVFLGKPSDAVAGHVRAALQETGGRLTSVVALREPVQATAIAADAGGTRYAGIAERSDELTRDFGKRMGSQYVRGGDLIRRVAPALFSSQAGTVGPVDAVVVFRDEPDLDGDAARVRDQLEQGFVEGARDAGAQGVGVETTATDPSQIPWYGDRGLSTVDDVDDTSGRAALVFAVAGADGDFGVKPSADALLPEVAGGAPSP
jgi:hypothetical protein